MRKNTYFLSFGGLFLECYNDLHSLLAFFASYSTLKKNQLYFFKFKVKLYSKHLKVFFHRNVKQISHFIDFSNIYLSLNIAKIRYFSHFRNRRTEINSQSVRNTIKSLGMSLKGETNKRH